MTAFNQIFQAATSSVSIFDMLNDTSDQLKEKDIDLEFDFDPLAFALAAKCENLHNCDIHNILETAAESLSPEIINQRDIIFSNIKSYQSQSDNIQKYYQNKILMRRLKGYHLTKFQESLEQLLDNLKKIKRSQLRILLKLDDFYQEDITRDCLFKDYDSIDGKPRTCELDDEFTFVKTIERFTAKTKLNKYYFKNSKNNLLEIESKIGSNESNLMSYLIQQPSVIIRGTSVISYCPQREDFLLYRQGNLRYYDLTSGK
jgi:hypothetical protein